MRTFQWSPIVGCRPISPGCKHCFAVRLVDGRLPEDAELHGLTNKVPDGRTVWNGTTRLIADRLSQPSQLEDSCLVSVLPWGDLFAEPTPDDWIDCILRVAETETRHVFKILTKRSRRARDYLTARWGDSPPPHIRFGVSAEDHYWGARRIPDLIETPAAFRFICCHPLAGPVTLGSAVGSSYVAGCIDEVELGEQHKFGFPAVPASWNQQIARSAVALGIRPMLGQLIEHTDAFTAAEVA